MLSRRFGFLFLQLCLELPQLQGMRVLIVFPNSPAEAAGLVPNKDLPYLSGAFASLLQNCEMCVLQDFLLGTTEVMFRDMDA